MPANIFKYHDRAANLGMPVFIQVSVSFFVLFLGHIACIAYMRPISTDVVAWSVYLSVCVLSIKVSCAKTAKSWKQ